MGRSISSGLRATLLLFSIVGGVLGLLYLIVPEAWGRLVQWAPAQPFDHRVIGLCFLAFALASWLAYRAAIWERVKIVVQIEIFWTFLAALLCLWGLLFAAMPILGWFYVVMLGCFALAFGVFYQRETAT